MIPDDCNTGGKWTTAFLTLLLSILLAIILKKRRHRRLPPGPFSLPILGNLLQLRKEPHLQIQQMYKNYGKVFRLYVGQQLIIVISGYRLAMEVLTNRSGTFSIRPDSLAGQCSSNGKSFALSRMSPTEHKRKKSLVLSAIKKTEKLFSFNSFKNPTSSLQGIPNSTDSLSGIELLISHEAVLMGRKLVQLGNEYERKYKHLKNGHNTYKKAALKIASIYSCTTMSAIVFGGRYKEHDEPNFIREVFYEMENLQSALNLLTCFSCLQKIWKKPCNTFTGCHKTLQGLVKMHLHGRQQETERTNKAEEKQNNINRKATASCSIIDHLLEMQQESQPDESWNEEMTISMITDTLGAGVDTGTIFPLWLMIYFAVFPDETKPAQAEVDKFIDTHRRMPTYNERYKLPRSMALLTEVIRHSSFVPFTIPHAPVKNTTLNGFEIPHGVPILVNLMSLNWDLERWKDPSCFRPDRFIQKNQSFNKTLSEKVNVHGAGKRLCAGITISRIQMFTVTSTFLHTFDFELLNKEDIDLPKASMFISLNPNAFNVRVSERPDET